MSIEEKIEELIKALDRNTSSLLGQPSAPTKLEKAVEPELEEDELEEEEAEEVPVEKPKRKAPPKAKTSKGKKTSFDLVKEITQTAIKEHKLTVQLRSLLNGEFEATKISELKKEDYAEYITKVEVLIAGGTPEEEEFDI